jgi:hypothetical protein
MFIATISFRSILLVILVFLEIGIVVAFLRRPIPPPTVPEC